MHEQIHAQLAQLGLDKTYVVAYSGGVDSHVLLHLLSQFDDVRLKAIHVNHHIHQDSDHWQQHCQRVCNSLGVDFHSVAIHVEKQSGHSLEATAREIRYHELQQLMASNDVLLTGHHQDDQAETVLLQLFRGAGVKGLSAMPKQKPFGEGCMLRPLLDMSRHDIVSYAKTHQLHWIEDSSNQDQALRRNFLRQSIIPQLQTIWPSVNKSISQSARHCAEAERILEDVGRSVLTSPGSGTDSLSISAIKNLPKQLQVLTIRQWLDDQVAHLPSTAVMDRIVADVVNAREDAQPVVKWGRYAIRRYQDKLYLTANEFPNYQGLSFNIDLDQLVDMKLEAATIKFSVLEAEGVSIKALKKHSNVTVRFRQGGETCCLPGRDHHHDLKQLMQEWKIPVWQRNTVPLLFADEKLVAVVGHCVCEGYAVDDGNGLLIELVPD